MVREVLARTFAEAEDYLKLPRGTLANSRQDTDFIAVMKMASTIEPLVNEALRAEVRSLLKHKVEHEGAEVLANFVTARGVDRSKKLRLACDLGIILESEGSLFSPCTGSEINMLTM